MLWLVSTSNSARDGFTSRSSVRLFQIQEEEQDTGEGQESEQHQ